MFITQFSGYDEPHRADWTPPQRINYPAINNRSITLLSTTKLCDGNLPGRAVQRPQGGEPAAIFSCSRNDT
jgi:hypothetical protein